MMIYLLSVIIGLLLVELVIHKNDKIARKAIIALAKEMNREIYFENSNRSTYVYVKNWAKEMQGCLADESLQSIVNVVNKHERSFRAIEKHFKIKIVCEKTAAVPEKEEVKVVFEKEVKTSNKRGK